MFLHSLMGVTFQSPKPLFCLRSRVYRNNKNLDAFRSLAFMVHKIVPYLNQGEIRLFTNLELPKHENGKLFC